MGAKSRRKGKRGELEAAAQIRRLFRTEARRGRQYQGTDESPDVLTDIPDVHFEVKRMETFRLYEAVEQAVAACVRQLKPLSERAREKLQSDGKLFLRLGVLSGVALGIAIW